MLQSAETNNTIITPAPKNGPGEIFLLMCNELKMKYCLSPHSVLEPDSLIAQEVLS